MTLPDRIENWARCMALNHGQGRAMSLEGAYRSPQHWEAPPPRPGPFLDLPDAYIVEAAWGSLPEFARYILRAHYCLRWPVPQTCRVVRRMTRLPCHQREFAKHLADAHEGLALALERDAQANRQIVRKWARKVLAILSPQRYKHTTTEQVRVA